MDKEAMETSESLVEGTAEKGDSELAGGAAQEPAIAEERPCQQLAGKESEPEVKVKTGRAKRREKRLKNEPQNVTVEEGPSGVHVLDFAEARATELSSMVKALRSKGGSKRTFQQLPRHMRRRAMSHNVKRLPRRLRQHAEREMDKSKTAAEAAKKKPKKASRKQRRKASSMRLVYMRRQRRHKWLETHLWHAKRMAMCEKYGYKMADHCSDKGVRQAYMSMTHGCLLSDISYYCCIEVCGEHSNIISSLSPLFSPETGLTIKAKAFLQGQREGKAVMYHPGAYPFGAIGPIQFLWRATPPSTDTCTSARAPPPNAQVESASLRAPPPNAQASDTSAVVTTEQSRSTKLWIWCHPAIHPTALAEIKKSVNSFNSKKVGAQAEAISAGDIGSAATSAVTVESLSLDLVRFRLIGPRSQALLMETLRPVLSFDDVSVEGGASIAESAIEWWEGELRPLMSAHSALLSSTLPTIRSQSSPAQVCKGSVIGMTVFDPRLFTPSKKTDKVSAFYPKKKNGYLLPRSVHGKRKKEERSRGLESDSCVEDECESGFDGDMSDMDEGDDIDFPPVVKVAVSHDNQSFLPSQQSSVLQSEYPLDVAFSPIWDKNVRKAVSQSKVPDHILNLERQKQLTRPNLDDLKGKAAKIPVLLVQQLLGSTHQGSGWDLILPSNWGMPFWVSLVYRGARACGMKELQKCSLEAQTLHFPSDYPDTSAGQQFSEEQGRHLEARYRRRPPDKRYNYGKFLISQPFCCPWNNVISAWSKDSPIQQALTYPPAKRVRLSSKEEVEAELFGSNHHDSAEVENTFKVALLPRKRTHNDLNSQANCDVLSSQVAPTLYVLRSRDILSCLHHFIKFVFSHKKSPGNIQGFAFSSANSGDSLLEGSRFFQASLQQFQIEEHLRSNPSALLAVKFETNQRGTVTDRASISLPSAKDLQMFTSSVGKSRAYSGPKEEINQRGLTVVDGDKIYIGVSSLCRKDIKKVKSTRLSQLKSDKQSKSGESCHVGQGNSSSSPPSAWNQFKLQPVRPSRMEIGYATSAGYRLSTSHFSGVGFCTFAGLIETIKRCFLAPGLNDVMALVRGETIQYWFIKLHVL